MSSSWNAPLIAGWYENQASSKTARKPTRLIFAGLNRVSLTM
jgi:hypothetical protein